MRLSNAAIAIAIIFPTAENIHAQGIGTSPLYDHGIAGLVTLQVETGIAFDQSYHGSSAFRARWDWPGLAISGAVGGAFGADRALLLALTPQVKVFNSCAECERRFVAGVFADGQRVHGGAAPSVMIGSIGLGASAQMDFVGFSADVSGSVRGGMHEVDDADTTENFWGASLGAGIGIPLSFEILLNLDYISEPPSLGAAELDDGWTLGFGIRVRAGPGT